VGKIGILAYVNQALLGRTYNATSKTIEETSKCRKGEESNEFFG